MAQYRSTVDSEDLRKLFSRNSQDSGLAKLLELIPDQVLKAQVKEQGG